MANTEIKHIAGFPDPYATKTQKAQPQYGLAYAKAMYEAWTRNQQTTRIKDRDRIQYLRMLSEGTLDHGEFMDQMFDGDVGKYINLDISIPPVVPKFVDILVNKIIKTDYYIEVEATDTDSKKLKDQIRTNLLVDIASSLEGARIARLNGLQPPEPPIFETADDVDIHLMTDFKLGSEIAAEKGMNFVFDRSHMDEVMSQVVRDTVVVGYGGTLTKYDVDGSVEDVYVDVENFIHSYASNPDFRKMQHGGHLETISISELRRVSGFEEDVLCKIAEQHAGKNNNPDAFSAKSISSTFGGNYFAYDNFQITIMPFQFLGTNLLVREKKETNKGYFRTDIRSDDYQLTQEETEKNYLLKKPYKSKYGGVWIVGTEYIYNYGEKTSPLRKRKTLFDTELDYTFYGINWYKQDNKSIIERIIPYAKQMITTHIKIQHLVMKSRPNGLAIDIRGIKEIDLEGNGEDAPPMEIVGVFDQTGNLLYDGGDDDGETQKRPPIMEIANGVPFNALRGLIEVYNFNHQAIRDVSGLNEVTDSSTPNTEMLVGVQNNAIEASNNATFSVYRAWENILLRTADKTILCLQDSIRKNKKAYESVLGEGSMATLDLMNDFVNKEFGFTLTLEPTKEQEAYLEQNIQKAIERDMLDPNDAQLIRNQRSFKAAQVILGMKSRKHRERRKQEMAAEKEQNAQAQIKIAQSAEAAKQKTIAIELDKELKIIEAEKNAKKELMEHEAIINSGEINLKKEADKEIAKISSEERRKSEEMKENRKDERERKSDERQSEMIDQRTRDLPARTFPGQTDTGQNSPEKEAFMESVQAQ